MADNGVRDIPEEGALPGEPVETKPFQARPCNDFLTAADVAAILRFATVERNRGDSTAADQILAQLHRSAVKTWGVGHRQLAPIAAEMDRWNVRIAPVSESTGAVRDIPEEMVEAVERAWPSIWLGDDGWRSKIRSILSAALAGRQVVDLPEPDDAPGRWGCIADWRPVVWEITAHLHANGEPRVDDDSRMFTADAAERHGLALIAAACAARRYAEEHRAAGSGSGEQP